MTEDEKIHSNAAGFRTAANDLQRMMNALASGGAALEENAARLFAYTLSITVLRALSAECMLKAIAYARAGSFVREHDLLLLYDELDGDIKGLIEKIADAYGVASPRRVLARHRTEFVDWRYPAEGNQSTTFLDLDKVLQVLHDVYRQIKAGTALAPT